jgi:AraC-like DNA-binding protein
MLRLARSHAFVAQPEDRYVAGGCWLAFCARGSTAGAVVWGAVTLEDVRAFMKVVPMSGSPLATRRPRYLDVRTLDGIDQAAVAQIASFLTRHAAELHALVSRVAVVSRSPLGRAIVNGFSALTVMPYELRFFDEPARALAWLGTSDSDGLARELDALSTAASGTTPLVRELRAYLAEHLHDGELATAARALGVSARGLQRKLRADRTTFQRELDRARFDAANIALARSELAIAEVARSVGTSPRNLTAVFRRLSGQSPRQRRQRG